MSDDKYGKRAGLSRVVRDEPQRHPADVEPPLLAVAHHVADGLLGRAPDGIEERLLDGLAERRVHPELAPPDVVHGFEDEARPHNEGKGRRRHVDLPQARSPLLALGAGTGGSIGPTSCCGGVPTA